MTKYDNELRSLRGVTGALADENRIRILMMLDVAELCVCQITAALNLAPSTVSRHLSVLENAGLIDRRKVGRWVYYRLGHPETSALAKDALKLVKSAVFRSTRIEEDRKKVRTVLKEDVNEVCKRLYHGGIPYPNIKRRAR